MRAFVLVAALVLTLVACVPATAPTVDPAGGVRLTAMPIDGATTYRVEVTPAVDRLFLRFVGTDLAVNATECVVTEVAVECVVGSVERWYEVSIGGTVTNQSDRPFGVACRATACAAVYLHESPE